MKIPEKTLKILEQYEDDEKLDNDFVFPELKITELDDAKYTRNKIKNGNKKINEHLQKVAESIGLEKPLTMYIAKHTFGHIPGDRIPVTVLQKRYRNLILQQRFFIRKTLNLRKQMMRSIKF